MVNSGRGRTPARGGGRQKPAARGGAKAGSKSAGTASGGRAQRQKQAPKPASVQPDLPTLFRLGAVPGATPGKWISIWRQRTPQTELELVRLTVADQRDALVDRLVDVALVRLPIAQHDLHVIPLYEERPVVAFSVESHLAAADDLTLADLEGETLFVPDDDVLDAAGLGATVPPAYARALSTEDVFATIATGAGITIVPMSLARLHHRKDVEYRELIDGPVSPIGLAWLADETTPAIDRFVGIVRGRTENSSRG